MTRSEIEAILGKPGLIKFNGNKYDKSIHGILYELLGQPDKVVLKRFTGDPMEIEIGSIRDFKAIKNPKIKE